MKTEVVNKSIIRIPGNTLINRLGLMLVMAIFIASCTADHPVNHGIEIESDQVQYSMNKGTDMAAVKPGLSLIQTVKKATARYHSTTQAIKAGYQPNGHCVEVPGLGGMGYHWVNPSLVDPVFDPAQPEAMLYERDKNGNLHLVAVEYIVIDIGQEHPHFGDHPFDIGGTPVEADHWSLHVWLYKDNPNGLFVPFNPNVACPD